MNEEWKYSVVIPPEVLLGDLLDYFESEIEMDLAGLVSELFPNNQLPILESSRVAAASLEYPILIGRTPNKKFFILDGHHRIAKAVSQNMKNIKAKILDLKNKKIPPYIRERLIANNMEQPNE